MDNTTNFKTIWYGEIQQTVFRLIDDDPDNPKCVKNEAGQWIYTDDPEPDIIEIAPGNWQLKSSNKTIKLYNTQKEAVSIIEDFFSKGMNPICGYPPGEGKTFIACETIKRFREKGLNKILVIIKSNNLEDPWAKDLKRFDIPFFILHGKDRRDDYAIDGKYENGGNVLVTTYDTGLLDIDYLNNKAGYDLIIFDELHSIINPKKLTQKSVGFAHLIANHRLALTATSIQNAEEDIGLAYIFLNRPDFLAVQDTMKNLKKDEEIKKAIHDAEKTGIIILPSMVSQKKFLVKSVLLSIPLSKDMIDFLEMYANLFDNNDKKLLSFLSSPESLYYYNSSKKIRLSCTKMDAVDMIIENTGKNEKVIIFSSFIDVLNSYYLHFKERGINALAITGIDRSNELKRKLSQFKDNNTFRILLTTIFKSAEGLNLEAANHVIILEFWWNPQRLIQAMGRIDRVTQTRNIFIYLLCNNINGKIKEPEIQYYNAMKTKIDYARRFIPSQKGLPELKKYTDEMTFKHEFASFLMEFNYTEKK
ncbi:hypothetical protein AGMMS49546_28300 [Spirochaetia bacterium]|nr:hypothetical protein AGMMS49546_28300 [Spirochaetia bacterium]